MSISKEDLKKVHERVLQLADDEEYFEAELLKKFRTMASRTDRIENEIRRLRMNGVSERKAGEKTVVEDFPDGLGFERCLQVTSRWEGGWSDNEKDPGGETNFGITEATYRRAVREGVIDPVRDGVRNLSRAHAKAIYHEFYWNEPRLVKYTLPAGVDLVVFDAAVNQGPKRAVRFLQKAINDVGGSSVMVDGALGPKTHEAVLYHCRNGRRVSLLKHFTVRRMLHWSGLGHMATFGRGWFRRGIDVMVTAIDPRGNL